LKTPQPTFRRARRRRLATEGKDLSIIGYGRPIGDALGVADELAKSGISIEIVDLRTIAPFDVETVLNSVGKTKRAVVVHEAVKEFGVGAELSSRIHEEMFSELKTPVRRVGSRYAPVPFSPALERDWICGREQILEAVKIALR
jgi:acetoin:2,6-dichlorophenolindophenol oxidoreductase subunit beta